MAYPQNYGLIRTAAGKAELLPIPLQKLPDDYVRVRPVAVAINPTDWTTLENEGLDGSLVGCDWAGYIEEVGPAVEKKLKKGDRVAGFSHGGNDANHENGAFARYIISKGDLVLHIPDSVSWEAASTVTVALGSTGMGMFQLMGLPVPGEKQPDDSPILIYGGSTATGSIAIQFAKLTGRKVITTCSPKNFDLVKDRGADAVYDYRSPDVGEQILKDTNGAIKYVFDTVAVESSNAICSKAIGPEGGIYLQLLGEESPREDVKSIHFLGYSTSGERYIFEGKEYPADKAAFEFAKKFLLLSETLWQQGKWKPHPQRVEKGGLIGAVAGMEQMKQGKVSGEKLVYFVEETQWP